MRRFVYEHRVLAPEGLASPRRILVVRRRYVGDLVLLEPFLHNLREAWPSARVVVVVDDGYHQVLRTCAWVDEIVELPVRGPVWHRMGLWWRLLRRIFCERFDLAFDLARNERSASVIALSGAGRRVSHEITDDASVRRRRWSDRFRRRMVSTDFVRMDRAEQVTQHVVDFNNRLLHHVGIPVPHRVPHLPVDAGDRERARDLLEGRGTDRRVAFLHPGGRGDAKQWPPERFAAIADLLSGELGFDVVLAAGPGEIDLVDEIAARRRTTGGLVIRTRQPLGVVYGLLAESALFVGNDSGPAHMAAAVGTPTFTLFGATRVAMWRTLGPLDAFVQPDLPCGAACLRPDVCAPGRAKYCVQRVTVDEVSHQLRALVARLDD